MKIKAAVCRAFNAPLSIEELKLADPKEHEVLVKMEACGFCHSDLHHWLGEIKTPLPMVFGHEACGIVQEIGPGVKLVKPGDRVIGCFLVPCGTCFQCRRGRMNLCETNLAHFVGGNLLDGTSRLTDKDGKRVGHGFLVTGFSNYSVMPEIGAIRVPEHIKVPPEQLCQLGCSVITGWGTIVNVANAREGSSIAVWGCGAIGLNTIRFAALRNCRPIIAVDLEESKRDIAMEFGATHFINNSKDDPIPIIQELTGGAGLEYVVEAIGDPGAQAQAIWALRRGGTMVATGVTPENEATSINFTWVTMHAKTIRGTIYGEARSTEDLPYLMEVMDTGALKTDKLVTRLIKLEELEEARRAMVARELVGRWVVKYD